MKRSILLIPVLILVLGSVILNSYPILADEPSSVQTTRNGKTYNVEKISRNIRVLKEAIDRGLRGEKIEFLNEDGLIIQTRDVFPKEAVRKSANYFLPSPEAMYMIVLNGYTILNENGKEEGHESASFYNRMGELMWREIPRIEDQESRFEFTSRFPRDNGTVLEILPFQAEIIHKNEKGEVTSKTQLQTWTTIPYYEADELFQVRFEVGDSSPYVAMARMDDVPGSRNKLGLLEPAITKRYELYLINADTGEIMWRREVANRGCDLEGIYAEQGVLIAREWDPAGPGAGSFRAYDLEGNELWEMSADPLTKVKVEDNNTLRLVFTRRVMEHSIVRDVPTYWKLIKSKTGETIEEGTYPDEG